MHQGDVGDECLVIDQGETDVRTATVIAASPVTAWSVDCRTFLAAVTGQAAAAITEHIAETHLARSADTASA